MMGNDLRTVRCLSSVIPVDKSSAMELRNKLNLNAVVACNILQYLTKCFVSILRQFYRLVSLG